MQHFMFLTRNKERNFLNYLSNSKFVKPCNKEAKSKIIPMCTYKKLKKFNFTVLLKCYFWLPKSNICPHSAWICMIFGLCIDSSLVKYLVKGIWFQMTVRWGLRMMHEKGEDDFTERKTLHITYIYCGVSHLNVGRCWFWKRLRKLMLEGH